MSSVNNLDVKKICRVCLRFEFDMKSLFESNQNPTIAQMLSELTMVKMQHIEELPHLICSHCFDLVVSAYELKKQCEKSHRTLMGLVDNEKNDISSRISTCSVKDTLDKSTQTKESYKYPCEDCEEQFLSAFSLKLHLQNKHLQNSLTCCFCSRSFESTDYLKTHLLVFHSESVNKSSNQFHICKRNCTKKSHKDKHIQTIHKFSESVNQTNVEYHIKSDESDSEKELYDVDNFGCLTDEEDEIPLSMLIESSNGIQITEEVLNNYLDDTKNTLIETENLVVENTAQDNLLETEPIEDILNTSFPEDTISICSKISSNTTTHDTKQCLEKPSKRSTSFKYCNKNYENNIILKQHKDEDHVQSRNFSCNICCSNFTSKKQLNIHLIRNHKESKQLSSCVKNNKKSKDLKLFHCTKCGKNFTTKNSLERHIENHNKKRFVCKECCQDFPTKDELNEHAKVEGHDKPLLCPECGIRCKSSNILTVHLRRHNGEKPFKCKFCSKGFPRIDDLKIHEKYHTGEKSHFCETCGKGFFRKYNLRIHMRVHTGEKPHKCPHCPQAFAQSNDLKAHIRRHTGERFRCQICNAAFLQGYQMRQHKLQEHGIHEIPPTQRVKKFTSAEEQEKQIQQNLQNLLE